MRGHLDIERRSIFEEVEKALVDLVIELRKEWYEEMKKAITKRDAKIARLEGQVETLTRRIGHPRDVGEVNPGRSAEKIKRGVGRGLGQDHRHDRKGRIVGLTNNTESLKL